jgi:uncharacterized protein (DUF433 family)
MRHWSLPDLIPGFMQYQQYIIRDPDICGGQPVLRGTRVSLRTVLASLAEGATVAEIMTDFPTLTDETVRAAIAFAAASAEEDLPAPAAPAVS